MRILYMDVSLSSAIICLSLFQSSCDSEKIDLPLLWIEPAFHHPGSTASYEIL